MSVSIFTIGLSNHNIQKFVEILKLHQINLVVDVRPNAFKTQLNQIDHPNLKEVLAEFEISCVYRGEDLIVHNHDPNGCDDFSFMKIDHTSQMNAYQFTLNWLIKQASIQNTAIIYNEEYPNNFRNIRLIGRALTEQNIILRHIQGSSNVETELTVPLGSDGTENTLLNDSKS